MSLEPKVPMETSGGSSYSLSSLSENPARSLVRKETFKPGWRFYMAFAALCVTSLMAALDATSLSVALPVMARAMNGTAIEAFWSGTSFLLTSTVFQPIIGSFSHIFGRKSLMYTSLVMFLAGSIIAALANNFTVILAGRSVQGVGGGGIIVLSEIIITDMVPLRQRGNYFSLLSAMFSIGTVTGPLLGGGFSQNVSWRWIFWINLPFLGIGAVMIALFLNLNSHASDLLSKLRRVDWVGMALFLSSTTGFLIPLTWGGIMYPWSSWRTLVPLIICGIGIIGFIIHQIYFAKEPLIRFSVFASRSSALTYLAVTLHGVILWSALYYFPLYFEAVKEYSPTLTGVALFPQTFTVSPAAIVAGIYSAKTGKYRNVLWLGWFLTVLGYGLQLLIRPNTPVVSWVFINIVAGLGSGMLFPAMALAVQAAAPIQDQAYAATMFSFMRSFGQTLGVAIGGVVFQNRFQAILLRSEKFAPYAQEYSRDASGLVGVIKGMADGAEKLELQTAYTDALRWIWVVCCVLGGVALLAVLAVEEKSLDMEMATEQGFKEMEKKNELA